MYVLKIAVSWVWVNSAFVVFHQVVTDMHERGSSESGPKSACFGVCRNETSEPIVGHTDRRNQLSYTAVLQTRLAKDGNLSNRHCGVKVTIGYWENISVVQKNYLYVAYDTFMHAQRDLGVKHDRYVIDVVYT